jgi:hypothetical protein
MSPGAVEKYVRSIRNSEKRRYAEDYAAALASDEPFPDETHYQLGAMAKQAVRQWVYEAHSERSRRT